jgi:general secretion pathway protein D
MQKTPTHPTRTTVATLMAAAAVMPVVMTTAHAGEGLPTTAGGYSSLAQREMVRRQQLVAESDRLRDEGRKAYAEKNYKEAYDKYSEALNLLPDAPLLQDRRDFLKVSMGDAAIALSEEYRRFGKYDEARTMLTRVVEEDPTNFEAQRRLDWLDDPIRTEPALTEELSKNIEKVRKGLYMGQSYYNLGQFDEARETYRDVLRVDPYNKAARRGMEMTDAARSDYYRAAYDSTRAELLAQVDQAWEVQVPSVGPTDDIRIQQEPFEKAGATLIMQKLRDMRVDVDFEDATVQEAIDYLTIRSRELDIWEQNPALKGINFVPYEPKTAGGGEDGLDVGGAAAKPSVQRIGRLSLKNTPMSKVLDFICDMTGLRWTVDEYAVKIKPAGDVEDDMISRTFNVPPDFVDQINVGGGGGGGTAVEDPFAPTASSSGGNLKPKPSVREALEKNGVDFSKTGANAQLLANSTLVVRNTPTNLDMIETLVQSVINNVPKQVKISTKFVEVSQENTDELGFDWIISPFGFSAEPLFLSGGTIGSGTGRTNGDFISPVKGAVIPGIPVAQNQNVSNILTGSLRSGDAALARNSIDAVLNNPTRAAQNTNVAPGILGLTGLFNDGQVQMIMRGLSQKKGTDLMTAPSVTARSAEKATIEIIREFIYPTEYEPPELPNSIGGNANLGGLGGIGGGGGAGIFPVTPATPTAFETRNTGVTLEILPTIGSNNFEIDLQFLPQIVEFEGFINYGSPIQSPSNDALGNPTTVTITDNRIEMPVFSTRRVQTQLTIYDGYTVAVGGLMREDVQNVEDKVPILGDIPILGRLFQTKAENRIKSNLIIFVTAEIIDASGRKLNRGGVPTEPVPTLDGINGVDLLPPLGS